MASAVLMSGPAPAAIVQQASDIEQPDVIEVVGARSNSAVKIDRRTYQVQRNPHSAQKDTLQLLRGLPAITISPDEQVNLLGAANVKILIDGHETQTDLHNLHGSDIDRIEIITNPSAQYSAAGTGGIINIVLRKKEGEGLAGRASAEAVSLGKVNANLSFKYKHGRLTYELEPAAETGTTWRSTYHKLRSVEPSGSGVAVVNTEEGGGPQRRHGVSVRAKVTYELDPKTSLSLESNAGASRSVGTNRANFGAVTSGFQPFSQVQRSINAANFLTGLLAFDRKGSRQGETLKASIWAFGNPYSRDEISTTLSDGGAFTSEIREGLLFAQSKVDWEHPIGKKQMLSIGAQWDLQKIRHHYRFTALGGFAGGDMFDRFAGRQSTLSAYGTFQQRIGTWTVMPGLRMERNRRRVSSPALPAVQLDHTDLFPTLHIEHPLGKLLELTLSYAKRIDRAQFDVLRPYRVVRDVLTVSEGNPSLRDQSTDAYEANLHYHRGKVDAGVIVYDRETKRLWSSSYSINSAGQNVYMLVNAGHRRDRGAEIDVSTPIIARVKLMSSINLFDSKVPIDQASGRASEHTFRATANSTVEWGGPDRGGKPGDVAQLQWQYGSPLSEFQFRQFAWHWIILSYTHNFSRSLSVTATADSGPLNNGHRLLAPLVQEYYLTHARGQFKVKLMKTLGNPQ